MYVVRGVSSLYVCYKSKISQWRTPALGQLAWVWQCAWFLGSAHAEPSISGAWGFLAPAPQAACSDMYIAPLPTAYNLNSHLEARAYAGHIYGYTQLQGRGGGTWCAAAGVVCGVQSLYMFLVVPRACPSLPTAQAKANAAVAGSGGRPVCWTLKLVGYRP